MRARSLSVFDTLEHTHTHRRQRTQDNEALRAEKRQFEKQKAFLQSLSQRAAVLTMAMTRKDRERDEASGRLAQAEERIEVLEKALHEANVKERRLREEMEPLRDDLCRLQEVREQQGAAPRVLSFACVLACLHACFLCACCRLIRHTWMTFASWGTCHLIALPLRPPPPLLPGPHHPSRSPSMRAF